MDWTPPPTDKRSRQQQFSDAAIQICLTVKVLFGMTLRQPAGFVESLLRLIGLNWAVPDFSTLCRRQKTLNVSLLFRGGTGAAAPGHRHYRQQVGKRRGMERSQTRRLETPDMSEITHRDRRRNTGSAGGRGHHQHCRRRAQLPELLEQIPLDQAICSVTADGVYDSRKCHDAIASRRAHEVIPRARTPSRGNLSALELSPAARQSMHRDTSTAPSGENGADTAAKAASRAKQTTSSFSTNPRCRETSTGRSPKFRSAARCSTATPFLAYPSRCP